MMVLVVCLYLALAGAVSGKMFTCEKPGRTFTDDACGTCHICHKDLTPTSLPTCENGTQCDITLGFCNFKDQVVCPSEMRTGWHRTVILMEKETTPGQDLFVQGGISEYHRTGCTEDARTSDCALDIRIRGVGKGQGFEKYNAYKNGDMKLDFYGHESHQGKYYGQEAEGTAMQWTTNDKANPLYNKFNTYGPNYWLLDMEMDCEQTEQGWFELQAYLRGGEGWEIEFSAHDTDCTGNIGGTPPYRGNWVSHYVRCGFVNVFHFGEPQCQINTVPSYDKESSG